MTHTCRDTTVTVCSASGQRFRRQRCPLRAGYGAGDHHDGNMWPVGMPCFDNVTERLLVNVAIVMFPETRVAAISHVGHPSEEHATARKLIAWKIGNRLLDPALHRSYGLHHTDPRSIDPSKYRVDFCLSFDGAVAENAHGITGMTIPGLRCAVARDVGSRSDNKAAQFLYDAWLPASGETLSGHPLIFHYVNVGPGVQAHEAITDVYMPIL